MIETLRIADAALRASAVYEKNEAEKDFIRLTKEKWLFKHGNEESDWYTCGKNLGFSPDKDDNLNETFSLTCGDFTAEIDRVERTVKVFGQGESLTLVYDGTCSHVEKVLDTTKSKEWHKTTEKYDELLSEAGIRIIRKEEK